VRGVSQQNNTPFLHSRTAVTFCVGGLWEYHLLFNMLHRRGNPNWGKAALSAHPHIATQFENEVRRLGLTKDTCVASVELRSWCEQNRNQRYVPEWLLETWGIEVITGYNKVS
jgi:hypothetical protein